MRKLTDEGEVTALLRESRILLLEFGSASCAPCASIRSRIDGWNSRRQEVQTRYVPMEEFPAFSAQYGIFSVPTVLVFVHGKMTIRESGFFSLDDILHRVERYGRLLE